MVRVLYVIPSSNIGGAETMLLTLIDALDRKQFTPAVCVIGGGPLLDEVKRRALETQVVPPFDGSLDLRFLKRFVLAVKQASPDIIHGHVWLAAFYSAVAGRLLGIPVVSTLHSKNELESLRERLALRLLARFSRSVVFVCDSQQRHFAAVAPIRRGVVIHNGLRARPPAAQDANSQSVSLRQEHGIASQAPVVTCVANFRHMKGHAGLIDAWPLVVKNLPAARLILLGDGECRNSLEAQCARLGILHSVLFLGSRGDVLPFLAISDVVVSPSLSECLSYAIMEAMSMGCPVVATDVGGNTDLIKHGDGGLLVPSCDPEALADGVCFLLSDRKLAARMGHIAQARQEALFTAATMASKYEALYLKVLHE